MWSKGSRVLAQWSNDQHWYPATVEQLDGQRLQVRFDHGSSGSVGPAQVVPLALTIGSRVEGNWQGGGIFYPGQITKQDGEKIFIRYDDGDEEWTKMSQARVPPGQVQPATPRAGAALWSYGDRVLAQMAAANCWYPGRVKSSQGDSVQVQFDDGSEAGVVLDRVRRLNIGVGSRVEGRWQGGATFYEGEITARDGDQVHVHYADGDQEWTSISMLRQRPEQVNSTSKGQAMDFDLMFNQEAADRDTGLSQEMQSEVDRILQQAQAAVLQIHQKAQADVLQVQQRAHQEVEQVQRQAQQALRDYLRQFPGRAANVQPDPGTLVDLAETGVGRSFLFEVTGSSAGPLWGTDVYTADSSLATAAVHAGVLGLGEKGVVRVTMIDTRDRTAFEGTSCHGVTSHSWGAYQTGFRVSRAGPTRR